MEIRSNSCSARIADTFFSINIDPIVSVSLLGFILYAFLFLLLYFFFWGGGGFWVACGYEMYFMNLTCLERVVC